MFINIVLPYIPFVSVRWPVSYQYVVITIDINVYKYINTSLYYEI
jgi:hypothetical protein